MFACLSFRVCADLFSRGRPLQHSLFCMCKSVIRLKSFWGEKPCGSHIHFAASTELMYSFPQCQFNPCYPGVKCVNTAPGFRCDACPLGFTGLPVEGVGVVYAQTNKQVKEWIEYGGQTHTQTHTHTHTHTIRTEWKKDVCKLQYTSKIT